LRRVSSTPRARARTCAAYGWRHQPPLRACWEVASSEVALRRSRGVVRERIGFSLRATHACTCLRARAESDRVRALSLCVLGSAHSAQSRRFGYLRLRFGTSWCSIVLGLYCGGRRRGGVASRARARASRGVSARVGVEVAWRRERGHGRREASVRESASRWRGVESEGTGVERRRCE